MNSAILPQLILPQTIYPPIRNGSRGIVFRLSENYAAKILYTGNCLKDRTHFTLRTEAHALAQLEHEAEITGYMYDFDLLVPKPVGVEKIRLFDNSLTTYPAYIMQYLPFPSGADLGFHEIGTAEHLAVHEIGNAIEYGFIPLDSRERKNDARNPNNFLYNRVKRKSYLIDFEFWKFEERNLFPIENLIL